MAYRIKVECPRCKAETVKRVARAEQVPHKCPECGCPLVTLSDAGNGGK